MHAYAGVDPIFLAMDAKGQRETDGALGDFCVQCHAPLASDLGLVSTGADALTLPRELQGVSCYYCHQVVDIEGPHNNPLVIAGDTTFRGGIADPAPTTAHGSAYSPLHDMQDMRSADLCGTCHDIVTPAGLHLERTYAEWRASSLAADPDHPDYGITCSRCHMPLSFGSVATVAEGVPTRSAHAHDWPGVDVALTDFPGMEDQRAAMQRLLDDSLTASLCLDSAQTVARVTLENTGAGHMFPSGAAADRRTWVELIAWVGDEVLWSTGVLDDGVPLDQLDDPALWAIRDTLFDDDDDVTHMFWEATSYDSQLLPPPDPLPASDPAHADPAQTRDYDLPAAPTRVTLRVRVRPIGLDVLDDLVQSGDLDPAIADRIPTFDLGPTALEWTADLPESEGWSCTEAP